MVFKNTKVRSSASSRTSRTQIRRCGTWDNWKIYPTYDFAHCLCDSFEVITHSLCTTEFVLPREGYEWLNRSLGVYEPMHRECGEIIAPPQPQVSYG